MGIRFVLMVNKQGQTRLAQYYEYLNIEERRALEGEIVRKCLARTEQQVSLSYLLLYFTLMCESEFRVFAFWFTSIGLSPKLAWSKEFVLCDFLENYLDRKFRWLNFCVMFGYSSIAFK